jgi:hypothetical protein
LDDGRKKVLPGRHTGHSAVRVGLFYVPSSNNKNCVN